MNESQPCQCSTCPGVVAHTQSSVATMGIDQSYSLSLNPFSKCSRHLVGVSFEISEPLHATGSITRVDLGLLNPFPDLLLVPPVAPRKPLVPLVHDLLQPRDLVSGGKTGHQLRLTQRQLIPAIDLP